VPTQSIEPSPTSTVAALLNSQPRGDSFSPTISPDGRYIAFVSQAQDLAGGKLPVCPDPSPQEGTIPCSEIFIYDRQSSTLSLVSVNSNGQPADENSFSPSISADGRWVAFASQAGNLDSVNAAQGGGVFVHDRQTGKTELVSANAIDPSISSDGRFVAFNQLGDWPSVSVLDRQTGNLVTPGGSSASTSAASLAPRLSANGRWLAFWSWNGDLVERDVEICGPSDTPYNCGDVFLYNGATGEIKRVKVGALYGLGMGSPTLSLSVDGRLVAFNDQLYDRLQGLTQPLCGRAEQACSGGALSSDGQVIAYRKAANFFRLDRRSGVAVQIDLDAQGVSSDAALIDYRISMEGESFEPGFDLSGDGRFIVFASTASNLHATDSATCSDGFFGAHNCYDIYLYDAQSTELEWISKPLP